MRFGEYGLHAWDVAAGALLVREAGGVVSAAAGGAFALDARSILATNGSLHDEMAAYLLPFEKPEDSQR